MLRLRARTTTANDERQLEETGALKSIRRMSSVTKVTLDDAAAADDDEEEEE